MFAIIKTGGKQYKVSPGTKLKVEKLNAAEDSVVHLDEVLLIADGQTLTLGTPFVNGARVDAKVLTQGRGEKEIVFRYHSKTRYRKKKGHRQPYTEVEIQKIIT